MRDGVVKLIDQRRLPGELVTIRTTDYRVVAGAIEDMAIRGAPAIGIAAAFGLALAAAEAVGATKASAAAGAATDADAAGRRAAFDAALAKAAARLRATRPTAVNLFWAIDRMMRVASACPGAPEDVAAELRREAQLILEEDVAANRRIGEYGRDLIPDGAGVLTHCNAGGLATGGYGTALGVIRAAHEAGKRFHVFADETRPLLQGARLTAWELVQAGIPATLITDNMAAHFMARGRIQVAVVGADRIAANGDVANKIGTYGVACLCAAHGIPLYVAAPFSTVDLAIPDGAAIPIEERRAEEVTTIGGVRVAPEGIGVANPAFDVTPARLVAAIITERGVVRSPLGEGLRRLAGA
jgi:methylthioribose-1-phosphate isomerase